MVKIVFKSDLYSKINVTLFVHLVHINIPGMSKINIFEVNDFFLR